MAVTFVIPVGTTGVHHLKSSVDSMVFFSGLQKHTVLFCAAPSVMQEAATQAARLKAICPNVSIESLPREPQAIGRFGAFNAIFRDSVEILSRRNKNPFFWWEEDMTAIRAGWADRLELEYHRGGQPFMGVRRKASDVMRGPKGEPLGERDPRVQGDYMVAVGMYPANFKDFSTLYKYPDPSGAMPTDVTIRHEVSRHLLHTEIIGHHYRTGNYRRDQDGRIICDDFEHQEGFPTYGGIVSDMAFVVHGDKTGTLAQLVTSEPHTSVSVSMAVSTPAPNFNSETTALQAENAELRLDIQRLTEQWSQKENSYADEIGKLEEQLARLSGKQNALAKTAEEAMASYVEPPKASADAEAEIVEHPVPAVDTIQKYLREKGVKVLLTEIAADLKCNKAELRKAIENAPFLKVAKQGPPWVSLVAA